MKSPVSDGDGAFLAEAFRAGMGRWAAAAPPNPMLASAWMRADRLLLEAELTNKVFDIRAKRDASGAWPAAIPGIEVSKAKDVSWKYAIARGRPRVDRDDPRPDVARPHGLPDGLGLRAAGEEGAGGEEEVAGE